jgi:hypothetical protein
MHIKNREEREGQAEKRKVKIQKCHSCSFLLQKLNKKPDGNY